MYDKVTMKILATGAAGRLGRYLEYSVRQRGDRDSVFLPNQKRSAEVLGLDVTDPISVRAAISATKPDVIVHLASLAGAACEVDPSRTTAVNVGAVRIVSEVAREYRVPRIIFASTGAVYGDQYRAPVDETAPLAPTSAYSRSKRDAEAVLREVAGNTDRLEVVILRIFNIYGPGFDQSLFSQLLESSTDAPVVLRNPDNFVRDYSHVSSVASAIEASAAIDLADRVTTFNIGSGVPINSRQIASLVATRRPPSFKEEPGPYSYSCADITSARTQLKLVPTPPSAETFDTMSSSEAITPD